MADTGASGVQALPDLSVYVHLPWCVRKCPYCDFNSHAVKGEVDEARYVAALLADLDTELPGVWGRSVATVFIGGGTPSLFSPRSIEKLLAGLAARLRLRPDAEITLEANPGAADEARMAGFVEAGVTRLSVGVQSFHDTLLDRIGRIHDGAAAHRAVLAALSSGAQKVNLDLMFALPGQTLQQVADDVATAVDLGLDHVSFYQLTLEPNTAFFRDPPRLPDSEEAWEMQQRGIEAMAVAGIERYEVSAYARPGAACAHNVNYWRFGDYLGIGAGAHGKLTFGEDRRVTRSIKQRHPRRYQDAALAGAADHSREDVPGEQLPFEFMLNALRLTQGVSVEDFYRGTGLPLEVIDTELEQCRAEGLLERSAERIVATDLGQRFLDDLVGRFLTGSG